MRFQLLLISWLAAISNALNIMSLGDSIVGSGCWQAILWQRLNSTGLLQSKKIEFVGTLHSKQCGFAFDGDNEGHSDQLVTKVAEQNKVSEWLVSVESPDMVLMHFGTYDLLAQVSPKRILEAYTTIVEQLRKSNIYVKIFVAQILPIHSDACWNCNIKVKRLNDQIPSWASRLSKGDSPIYVVDQYDGYPSRNTIGGILPDELGDELFARKWYHAIVPHL